MTIKFIVKPKCFCYLYRMKFNTNISKTTVYIGRYPT